MTRNRVSRRNVLKRASWLAAAGAINAYATSIADAGEKAQPAAITTGDIDLTLHAATSAGEVPGVVAMAASHQDIIYEGVFGKRELGGSFDMTRDTIFRIGSMIKPITTVAALQLVEKGKLSLDGALPDIDPALAAPQVFEGVDGDGNPQLRPARRPIALRHLLTHTAGFTYRLWDAKAVQYFKSLERSPPSSRDMRTREPLMFDPGERWQYGTSIDWVGRIVEHVSGQRLDAYFRRHILDPLGMHDTAFIISPEQRAREARLHQRGSDGGLIAQAAEQPTERSSFAGGGGIYSTAPDYLTFVTMLMVGGSLKGARILRPETVELMRQNQIGEIEAGILRTTMPVLSNNVDFFPGISLKWGYGHMINMVPGPDGRSAGSLTWGGLFNTYYWIDPNKRIAAVFMTQVLPFADEMTLRLYGRFERGLYNSAANSP
jgi:CubicO group peptidase (beta-lactamase class C family)